MSLGSLPSHPLAPIILMVHALPWHRAGGLERATWMMLEGLLQRGHRVVVLTTPLPRARAVELGVLPGEGGWTPSAGLQLVPGRLSVEFVGGRAGHPGPGFWWHGARRARALAHELRHEGHGPVIVGVDLAPLWLRGEPFVLQVHGTLFSETTLHRGFAGHRAEFPLLQALWRFKGRLGAAPFFRPMLHAASAIICDSQFIHGELQGLSPTGLPPCQVVPLALPSAWGEALRGAAAGRLAGGGGEAQAAGAFTAARPLRVLAVGRQSRIKGFEVAMAALGEVVALRGPVVRMQVAGEASASADDRPQFCHAPWLEFMGRVDDARLAQAYADADVFVNVEYNQPAFGLVALEALTAGCPVVVSRRGALPEVLGDACGGAPGSCAAGWVVEAGDARALARVLMEILDAGPAALEARRLAAAARASVFDPATYFVQLFEVLDGVVNDGENA